MLEPRITVGVPVYRGAEYIAKALDCLQRQTFRNFEVIISVDGADEETAAACGPFLADPRFRMIVQPDRLDWFGNFNWLLQQDLREFFCYRQHDDTTAPEFFEVLLQAADSEPGAAIAYCDCQFTGGRSTIEIAPSIEGQPLGRMLQYIEQLPPSPCRGVIRTTAIRQAGLVRCNEFRALGEIHVWLAKVLRWGNFRRVPQPLYYKLDHPHNYSKDWYDWPEERKRAAWTTLFTGLLEAAMPLCRTPEERLFLRHVILERIVVFRPTRGYLYRPNNQPHSGGRLIAECLERLRFEGNEHLLGLEELPAVLQQAALRLRDSTQRIMASEAECMWLKGTTLHFGEGGTAYLYQVTGCHLPERWGCWMGSDTVKIVLPLANWANVRDVHSRPLKMVLEAQHFLVKGRGQSPMRVSVNGELLLHTVEHRTGIQRYAFEIPSAIHQSADRLLIELEAGDAMSPAALDWNNDKRLLSIGLVSLTIDYGNVSTAIVDSPEGTYSITEGLPT